MSQAIAIVGIACRFPGNVRDTACFWERCAQGRDFWSSSPSSESTRAGNVSTLGGYLLRDSLSQFDARFFGYGKAEAEILDPRQRLLLECCYESIENAGFLLSEINGSSTGVYISTFMADWHKLLRHDSNNVPRSHKAGSGQYTLSNQLAYFLDVHGPCITIDASCTGGLTAIHLACQAIKMGECEQAIVGGSNLILSPDKTIQQDQLGYPSPYERSQDCHCHQCGYPQGEGAAFVVLKSLQKALEDGDPIRAVIRHSGMNQDGKTSQANVSDGEAQVNLILSLYTALQVDPCQTDYVEAHGAGTPGRDLMEARVISRVFCAKRPKSNPLTIGTVKTNIGNLEGASGIASLIKVVLMLERRQILPNANLKKPNLDVPLSNLKLKMPEAVQDWTSTYTRRASINHFEHGGTNAHLIIEEALDHSLSIQSGPLNLSKHDISYDKDPISKFQPVRGSKRSGSCETVDESLLFVLSAHCEVSARGCARDLCDYLSKHYDSIDTATLLKDLAYTLSDRRTLFPYRLAVTAKTIDELREVLNPVKSKFTFSNKTPQLIFAFTGQGAQWFAMGRELIGVYECFGDSLRRAGEFFNQLGASWSLIEELYRDERSSKINTAVFSQPICTAVQLGLVDLLSSWGVRPQAVIGHSSGEIAAAYAAGGLSFLDALRTAFEVGRTVFDAMKSGELGQGAMMAAGLSAEQGALTVSRATSGKAVIACYNSPTSLTLAGDIAAIDEIEASLKAQNIFARKLLVQVAYHSHHIETIMHSYLEAIKNVKGLPTQTATFYSTVEGRAIDTPELDASYWAKNLLRPVRFSETAQLLCSDLRRARRASTSKATQENIFIEVGPHSALGGSIKQIFQVEQSAKSAPFRYVPTLVRGKKATISMVALGGTLFESSYPIDIGALNRTRSDQERSVLTSIPPYAWDHSVSYHIDTLHSSSSGTETHPCYDLLGAPILPTNCLEPQWLKRLRPLEITWLRDYRIHGAIAYPFAAYIMMAIQAITRYTKSTDNHVAGYKLRNVSLGQTLFIDDTEYSKDVIFTLHPYRDISRYSSGQWMKFRVCSSSRERESVEHCRGLITTVSKNDIDNVRDPLVRRDEPTLDTNNYSRFAASCTKIINMKTFYDKLSTAGIDYGSAFACLQDAKINIDRCFAHLIVPDLASRTLQDSLSPFAVHPACIESTLHAFLAIRSATDPQVSENLTPMLVKEIFVDSTLFCKSGKALSILAFVKPDSGPQGLGSLTAFENYEESPQALIRMEGVIFASSTQSNLETIEVPQPQAAFRTTWESAPEFAPSGQIDATSQAMNDKLNATNISDICPNPRSSQDAETNENSMMAHHNPNKNQMVPPTVNLVSADGFPTQLHNNLQRMLQRVDIDCNFSGILDAVYEGRVCICTAEMKNPILHEMNSKTFEMLQRLWSQSSGVIWVTRGSNARMPELAMVNGLARTVRLERKNTTFVTVDLDPQCTLSDLSVGELIFSIFRKSFLAETGSNPIDLEYRERGGILEVPRVIHDKTASDYIAARLVKQNTENQPFFQEGRRLKLAMSSLNALKPIHFIEDIDSSMNLKGTEVEIQVKAVGLNFRETIQTIGQMGPSVLGNECSGIISRIGCDVKDLKPGDRVVAFVDEAFANFVSSADDRVLQLPDSVSFEVGATLPLAYCTALHSVKTAKLMKGERILIHAAMSGVGQALITLCRLIGAEIFATAGTKKKMILLKDRYSITEDHIFNSRDGTFAKGVMRQTEGTGVDVAISCVTADLRRQTLECMAEFGRVVELGIQDRMNDSQLELGPFAQNLQFSAVNMHVIVNKNPAYIAELWREALELLSCQKIETTRLITKFTMAELEKALACLRSGENNGKIVVVPRVEDVVKVYPSALSGRLFRPDATYVLVGGLGGLGRAVATWMVTRGAKHIAFLSRSGPAHTEAQLITQLLKRKGAACSIQNCDVTSTDEVHKALSVLKEAAPPIRGLMQMATVQHGTHFQNMTLQDWEVAVRPKVHGTWNLHNALLQTEMDFFIMFSSLVGTIGNVGQAAYGAASTFMDEFAQYRHSLGLPVMTVDLGAVSEIGHLSESPASLRNLQIQGWKPVREKELTALLEYALLGLRSDTNNESIMLGLGEWFPSHPLCIYHTPKFSYFRSMSEHDQYDVKIDANEADSVRAELQNSTSSKDAIEIVSKTLIAKVARLTMVPLSRIDEKKSLLSQGVDSLDAIKLREWLSTNIGCSLSVFELMANQPISHLCVQITEGLNLNLS